MQTTTADHLAMWLNLTCVLERADS